MESGMQMGRNPYRLTRVERLSDICQTIVRHVSNDYLTAVKRQKYLSFYTHSYDCLIYFC